jgi:hypothetical protein
MQRAFARTNKELSKDLRSTLRDVAEPVRSDAASRAAREIPNIGPRWSQMRVGVTRHSVYVAPKVRGRGRLRRPNFATLLMERAMQPALDAHESQLEDRVDDMLGALFKRWER